MATLTFKLHNKLSDTVQYWQQGDRSTKHKVSAGKNGETTFSYPSSQQLRVHVCPDDKQIEEPRHINVTEHQHCKVEPSRGESSWKIKVDYNPGNPGGEGDSTTNVTVTDDEEKPNSRR